MYNNILLQMTKTYEWVFYKKVPSLIQLFYRFLAHFENISKHTIIIKGRFHFSHVLTIYHKNYLFFLLSKEGEVTTLCKRSYFWLSFHLINVEKIDKIPYIKMKVMISREDLQSMTRCSFQLGYLITTQLQ